MGRSHGAQARPHFENRLRRPVMFIGYLAVLSLLAFTVACAGDDGPADNGATSTPVPTDTPTTPPTAEPGGGAPPVVDQALVEGLLAPIPADFERVAFVDVAGLAQDPDLKQVLEAQGVLEGFGPAGAAIQDQLVSAVVAGRDGEVIGVMGGSLEIPKLIELLKAFGAAVETSTQGEFEVVGLTVDTEFLKVRLAVAILDEETFIFASGASEETSPPALVVSALETLGGTEPGFVSQQGVKQLLEAGLPPGFIITIFKGCEDFGDVQGCQAWAVGFTKEGDAARVRTTLSFESPEIAQAALPVVQQIVAEDPDVPAEATVEGSLVLIDAKVPLSALLE